MQFEHLVVVNDPLDPLAEPLSRLAVWRGLMWRAEEPGAFQEALVGCRILDRSAAGLARELDYGRFTVRDSVEWQEGDWIMFSSAAEGERAGGELRITIEEPSAGCLVLRFRYRTTLDDAPGTDAARYAGFVKSAYREADIDTVRRIRELAGRADRH